jgi:hypothetical protein
VQGLKNELMDARVQNLMMTISELEDHYADLLTRDASEKELFLVWTHIRELRKQLSIENAGLQAVPYFYGRRPDKP